MLEYNDLRQAIKRYNNLVFENKNEKERLVKLLKDVFNYGFIIKGDLRNKNLNKVGINVCPYCGRQFISSYEDDDKERNSADLDHFFAKNYYPFLALSLYNFVPSCSICNSKHKHKKDFFKKEHLYPYKEGFGYKARFDIAENVLISDIITGKEKAEIIINRDDNDEKINNSIKTFRLEQLYKNHSKDVQNLFRLIQIYSQTYVTDIVKILDSNIDISLGVSEKEHEDKIIKELNKKIDDMMMIIFREKDDNEILSKLYNDLLDKYWRNL